MIDNNLDFEVALYPYELEPVGNRQPQLAAVG